MGSNENIFILEDVRKINLLFKLKMKVFSGNGHSWGFLQRISTHPPGSVQAPATPCSLS
jgi:hypothetical protein